MKKRFALFLYFLVWFFLPLFLLLMSCLPVIREEYNGVVYYENKIYGFEIGKLFFQENAGNIMHMLIPLLCYCIILVDLFLILIWILELREIEKHSKRNQIIDQKYTCIRGCLAGIYFLLTNVCSCCLRLYCSENVYGYMSVHIGEWYEFAVFSSIVLIAVYVILFPVSVADQKHTWAKRVMLIGGCIFILKKVIWYITGSNRYAIAWLYKLFTYLDDFCFFVGLGLFLFVTLNEKKQKLPNQLCIFFGIAAYIYLTAFFPLFWEYYHFGILVSMLLGLFFLNLFFARDKNKKKKNNVAGCIELLVGMICLGLAYFIYINLITFYNQSVQGLTYGMLGRYGDFCCPIFRWMIRWKRLSY